MTTSSKTFSLTFGDVAENHKGMQKIGTLSNSGFNLSDLTQMKTWFEAKGCKCNIINLHWLLVNKHARHNLCFGEQHQEPNYEEGMGTVYAFDEVPLLKRIRCGLGEICGEKGANLQAEGNYYYDVSKCGIGFHGDTERKKVIAFRLGAKIPLCYTWYHNNENISEVITIDTLEHGDMYVMSEKTTGFDWKSK